ncbi:hypothetical protein [Aquiflexum sp.]|uniref:hypothetical protein n=1 Tax=Aquiflexum sp. TaxID=1872584 RepID=UPI00359448DA
MKIARIVTVLIFMFLVNQNSFAQEVAWSRFGLQVSYGNPHYIPSYADGAPNYNGRYFFDIGFLYLKPLSEKWEFETGLVYSNNQFRVTPTFPPGISNPSYNDAMNHWTIPANFRLWLPKRFLLQFGPNISQASSEFFGVFRLGFSLGFGKEFNLGDKNALLIIPTFNANPFFPTNTEGMTQLGIRSIFAFPTKK